MRGSMTKDELWNKYKTQNSQALTYEAWAFCDGGAIGDVLAQLVLDGTKTATASAYQVYGIEQSSIPSEGCLSIIMWSNGDAACIIRTTSVTVEKFCDVTAAHAFLEGEDDRSLGMWRLGHQKYFTQDLNAHGLSFSEDMPVVCERFEVVCRP